jgi:hypothetical protein
MSADRFTPIADQPADFGAVLQSHWQISAASRFTTRELCDKCRGDYCCIKPHCPAHGRLPFCHARGSPKCRLALCLRDSRRRNDSRAESRERVKWEWEISVRELVPLEDNGSSFEKNPLPRCSPSPMAWRDRPASLGCVLTTSVSSRPRLQCGITRLLRSVQCPSEDSMRPAYV